jgi:hypothetical protein
LPKIAKGGKNYIWSLYAYIEQMFKKYDIIVSKNISKSSYNDREDLP